MQTCSITGKGKIHLKLPYVFTYLIFAHLTKLQAVQTAPWNEIMIVE
jgi:hypothetical protein